MGLFNFNFPIIPTDMLTKKESNTSLIVVIKPRKLIIKCIYTKTFQAAFNIRKIFHIKPPPRT